jgi:hypothetical protein
VGGPPRRRRGPVLIIAGVVTAAVDPDISFSTTGKPRFSPCSNSSCTAKFSIQNLVNDPLGTASGDPVHAVITIDVKLDGHTVKHCVFHRTLTSSPA